MWCKTMETVAEKKSFKLSACANPKATDDMEVVAHGSCPDETVIQKQRV